jgi:hypothetical protein
MFKQNFKCTFVVVVKEKIVSVPSISNSHSLTSDYFKYFKNYKTMKNSMKFISNIKLSIYVVVRISSILDFFLMSVRKTASHFLTLLIIGDVEM